MIPPPFFSHKLCRSWLNFNMYGSHPPLSRSRRQESSNGNWKLILFAVWIYCWSPFNYSAPFTAQKQRRLSMWSTTTIHWIILEHSTFLLYQPSTTTRPTDLCQSHSLARLIQSIWRGSLSFPFLPTHNTRIVAYHSWTTIIHWKFPIRRNQVTVDEGLNTVTVIGTALLWRKTRRSGVRTVLSSSEYRTPLMDF